MQHLRRRRSRWILLVVACAIAVTFGVLVFGTVGAVQSPPPQLLTVNAAELATSGISLATPQGSANISEEDARGIIGNRLPGTTIRELVLAQFVDSHRSPVVNQLCWVASVGGYSRTITLPLQPGQPRTTTQLTGFLVVAIDAGTGDFVESLQGPA